MGWKSSVKIGHAVTTVLQNVDDANTSTLSFIDNGYRFGNTAEAVQQATNLFLERARQVEANISITTPPTNRGVILGIEADLMEKTLCLPAPFLDKLSALKQVFSLLAKGHRYPTHRLVWKVLGSLFWAARVLGIPQCSFPEVVYWIRGRARRLSHTPSLWDKPCHMSSEFVQALIAIILRVETNKPRRLTVPGEEEFEFR